MPRPIEYENLIRIGSLKQAVSNRASIDQFVRTAEEMRVALGAALPDSARFNLAYEGMFNVAMAVLEFFEARPGDGAGHRASAIARVAADLALAPQKQSVLARLHDTRNRVTYRSSVPPISKAEADAMAVILEDMLVAARVLVSPGGPQE